MSVRDALVSITDATLSQVRLMEDTRDRNLEDIDRRTSRIETDGFCLDGSGGGDTGGHGRH